MMRMDESVIIHPDYGPLHPPQINSLKKRTTAADYVDHGYRQPAPKFTLNKQMWRVSCRVIAHFHLKIGLETRPLMPFDQWICLDIPQKTVLRKLLCTRSESEEYI
ncbi:hypothetical protein Ddc_00313 [Ditylenchus destructor]|nr:hypothetical protein Ddc_00313 [Ditylenchus destructor]